MTASARLWAAAPRARWWLYGAILLGTAASAAWVALLLLVAAIVAAVFIGGAGPDQLAPTVGVLVAVVAGRSALMVAAAASAQQAASHAKEGERRRIAASLRARKPVSILGERSGELVHFVTADVERLDGYIAAYLPARAAAVIVPLVVAVLIAAIDPLTLPILLFAGPLLVLILALVGRTTRIRTRRRERELTWLDGHFLDMIRGLPTLRLFGRSHEQAETIDRVARRLASSSLDVLRTAFQTSLVLEWGATAATALVAISVSVRLMAGEIAFDRALAVLLLTPECFAPVRRLAGLYHQGAAGRAALDAIGDHADDREVATVRAPSALVLATARSDPPWIRIVDLTARYPEREDPVLRGISLELDPCRLTVLAGPTGAGKSTLVAVLLRFLAPDAGVVEADGTDIAELDPAAWRRRVAWLPQHPHLFDGTVAANLRLGRPGATDDEVRRAARSAAVTGVIEALPLGYETLLGEGGVRLSGGEVARVALGRALLRGAPFLVVDEPTAHLDPVTAGVIRTTLLAARETATVLAISHDPELAALADRVVVLEAGRIRVRRGRAAASGESIPKDPTPAVLDAR